MKFEIILIALLLSLCNTCYCRLKEDSISIDDYIKYSDLVAEVEILEVDTFKDGRGLSGYSVGFSFRISEVLLSKEKIVSDSGIIRCERHFYGKDNSGQPLGNYVKGLFGLTYFMVFNNKIDCIAFAQSNAFYEKDTEGYVLLKKKISMINKKKRSGHKR